MFSDHRPALAQTTRPSTIRYVHALHPSATATLHYAEPCRSLPEWYPPRSALRSTDAPGNPPRHDRTNQESSTQPARPSAHTSASPRSRLPCPTAARAPKHAEYRWHRSEASPRYGATPHSSAEYLSDRSAPAIGNPSPTRAHPAEHEWPRSSAHRRR